MNARKKAGLSWILRIPLAACLAWLAVPGEAVAAGSDFDTYDLGHNDRGRKDGDRFIGRAEAKADLDALTKAIDENSAYMWSSTFDYRKSLKQIASTLPEQVSVNGFAAQINRFVRLFGDDHAQVLDWSEHIPQGGVSFRIGKADARHFLYLPATGEFLEPGYPYVRSMDGVAIHEWMRAAGDIGQGPLSSEAARFGRAFRVLPYIDHLRAEMGLPMGGPLALEMVAEDGVRVKSVQVALQDSPGAPSKPFGLPESSRVLPGNIGYLRIGAHTGELSEQLVRDIPARMQEFRDTDALIIDARQSGGGKRAVLNALFPYFMPADAKPYVFNVVKLRKSQVKPDQDPASLFDDGDKRFLYVADKNLPAADASAYREFASGFIPAWTPPVDRFTDWYFMALSPQPDKPFYGKPVYMLIDWGVGSAGDIFASAFKSWPGVTMVGTPTMGRSGQGRPYRLPNSGLDVNLSTMASFQKTGERYDTVGIQPDIAIEPVPTDWIGKSDSVLDRVQALVARRLGKPAQGAAKGRGQ